MMADVRYYADYLAPNASEIRQLVAIPDGGLAHCVLPASSTSLAHEHRRVDEIWCVLAGSGELWRGSSAGGEVIELLPGRAVTIPPRTGFQFRSARDRPLELPIATFPQWPGAHEAKRIAGVWTP